MTPDQRARGLARPVRAYDVIVGDHIPVRYCARSPSKAMWRAFLDYRDGRRDSFAEFLIKARVRARPDIGLKRVLVCGKPATLIGGTDERFIYDGSDVVMRTHPSDMRPLAPPEWVGLDLAAPAGDVGATFDKTELAK